MNSELDPRLDDFRTVLCLIWRQILGQDPTPVQYDMGHYLQTGPRRMVLEAFRGVGKSWETSAFAVDCLRRDPSMNILCVSASKERADNFSTFALRLIEEIEFFQFLKPRADQRKSKIAFDVGPAPASHSPSIKSVGINGMMTGSRADLIIADDVESLNNSATQGMRDKLSHLIKEFDAILKPGGRVIFLGTPQTEQSIYNDLPKRGYSTRIYPVRFPSDAQRAMYGDKLAPIINEQVEADPSLVGKSTEPDRFSDEDLAEREASYGRSGFALQFMLDTRLSDADRYPLKLADLVVMDLDDEVAPEKVVWARDPALAWTDLPIVGFNGDRFYRPLKLVGTMIPYTGSVMAVDPSGRGKDETAFSVVKMLNGQLFAPEITGLAGGYSEATLTQIALRAKAHRVNKIVVEANFGDGMFTQLLKPVLGRIWPCTVEEVKHNVQKERRIIDTLEPVLNSHKLILGANVVRQDGRRSVELPGETSLLYQFVYQMSRITRDRGALAQDDRLDSLAMAVAYWTEQMARDVDRARDEYKIELADTSLREFEDGILGAPVGPRGTWLDNGLRCRTGSDR